MLQPQVNLHFIVKPYFKNCNKIYKFMLLVSLSLGECRACLPVFLFLVLNVSYSSICMRGCGVQVTSNPVISPFWVYCPSIAVTRINFDHWSIRSSHENTMWPKGLSIARGPSLFNSTTTVVSYDSKEKPSQIPSQEDNMWPEGLLIDKCQGAISLYELITLINKSTILKSTLLISIFLLIL